VSKADCMRTRFRARNWREWKDLDEDEEFSGFSDDDKQCKQ
jgi:hypothetical protein